jgi:hypothetical protein
MHEYTIHNHLLVLLHNCLAAAKLQLAAESLRFGIGKVKAACSHKVSVSVVYRVFQMSVCTCMPIIRDIVHGPLFLRFRPSYNKNQRVCKFESIALVKIRC